MITRLWHGWTTRENAEAYKTLLQTKILPGIFRIPGYLGAYLLRREVEKGVEFVTLTLWDSMEAVRAFAGDEQAHAVVPPEARKLLSHFDEASLHYETVMTPENLHAR